MGRHHHRPTASRTARAADVGVDKHADTHAHLHGHAHAHGHSGPPNDRPLRERLAPRTTAWTPSRVVLAVALFLGAVATAVALVVQWPTGAAPTPAGDFSEASPLGVETQEGTVAEGLTAACPTQAVGSVLDVIPAGVDQVPAGQEACHLVAVDIHSGADEGRRTLLTDAAASGAEGAAHLESGDEIRLAVHTGADGTRTYGFQDFHRTSAFWFWLLLALAGIAVVGAWRGVRAVIGLAVTLGVIGVFLLPALARGESPVPAAITACAAVLYLVLFLVHGANWKTASALGGTLTAMLLGVGIAQAAIGTNRLRGLGDENNLQVLLYLPGIEITGLLTAGFILGTLGVLNDVTVAQSATIAELRELDPAASRWKLFTRALRVGRDHLASTVYTLVLSYAGATLPLLVLLGVSGRGLAEILTSDTMATEVMRSVTGSLALVAAVPLTTLIAAWTVGAPRPARAAR